MNREVHSSATTTSETSCCLMASRTRKTDHLPDFALGEAGSDLSKAERELFPGLRIAGEPQPISCRFPRSIRGGIPNIDIIGSTATRLATPSERILTSSLRLAVERMPEVMPWPEIAATAGRAATLSDLGSLVSHDRPLLDLAHNLSRSLVRHYDDDETNAPWQSVIDSESFDLSGYVDTIFERTGPIGSAQPHTMVKGLQRIDVGVVLVLCQSMIGSRDTQALSGDDTPPSIQMLEGEFVQRDRGSHRSIGIVIQSRHVAPDVRSARNEARKFQEQIHCLIDVLSGHLFLLEAAFQVQSQLMDAVSSFVSAELDSRARERTISDIWQLRTESLWRFERPWALTPKGGLYTKGPLILEDFSSTLGITREWERCKLEVDRILAVADYSASHEANSTAQLVARLPEVPRVFFPDPLRDLLSDRQSKADDPGLLRSIAQAKLLPSLRGIVTRRASLSEPDDSSSRRLVEIHPFQNRETIIGTIGSRITTSALLTATAGLLLGLLLSRPENLVAPHDALLLLVATISFFFETLMLANVSRSLQFTTLQIARNAERASGVALFLGQYPFAIALALSMTRLIGDQQSTGEGTFLVIVVSILTLMMMILYFDVTEAGAFGLRTIVKGDMVGSRESRPPKYSVFGPKSRRQLMAILHLLAAMLLIGAINSVSSWIALPSWLMWMVEFALLGMLVCMAAMSWVVAGSERYSYYEVDAWDCMGAEQASFFDADWRSGGLHPR